jgi:hypothetical protein
MCFGAFGEGLTWVLVCFPLPRGHWYLQFSASKGETTEGGWGRHRRGDAWSSLTQKTSGEGQPHLSTMPQFGDWELIWGIAQCEIPWIPECCARFN